MSARIVKVTLDTRYSTERGGYEVIVRGVERDGDLLAVPAPAPGCFRNVVQVFEGVVMDVRAFFIEASDPSESVGDGET